MCLLLRPLSNTPRDDMLCVKASHIDRRRKQRPKLLVEWSRVGVADRVIARCHVNAARRLACRWEQSNKGCHYQRPFWLYLARFELSMACWWPTRSSEPSRDDDDDDARAGCYGGDPPIRARVATANLHGAPNGQHGAVTISSGPAVPRPTSH